mgnify:CR=1 FL=1
MPYSSDLRERVLHALEVSPLKREEIAAQYQICPATLYNWQKQRKQEGRTTPKQVKDTLNLLAPAVCAGSILNRYKAGLIGDDYGYGYGHHQSYGEYYY